MSQYTTVQVGDGPETFTTKRCYRIVRRVGSGAYGTVCSAYDLQCDRYCAIKKVYKVFDKRLLTKRCLREIKLLQHFNGHPRIIELFDMDIVDINNFNEIYLVFDCMDASLHDVIHSEQPLDNVHNQWFLYQMLSGLKYIHAADVIHRDLKPANILVNRDCDIKICDFGMARGHSLPDRFEFMTEYVTTRWYRAPEVMINIHNYSKLIDMWSVGCIFGELLGRKVLFKGRDYVDQLYKILSLLGLPNDISFWDSSESVVTHIQQLCSVEGRSLQEPVIFSTLFPHCPDDGIDILKQLLQLDPAKRIDVDTAVRHPYVAVFADPEEEGLSPSVCDFNFESCGSEVQLRQMIINEVEHFHPNVKAKEKNPSLTSITPNHGQTCEEQQFPSQNQRAHTTLPAKSPIPSSYRLCNMPTATVSVLDSSLSGETQIGVHSLFTCGFVCEPEELSLEDTDVMQNYAKKKRTINQKIAH